MHAQAMPDGVALIDGDRRWSWRELLERRGRLGGARPPWAERLEELIATGSAEAPAAETAQGLGGSMIYTGGTTGRPKGALRGAVDPQVSLRLMAALDLAVAGHVHLVAGPLYHS